MHSLRIALKVFNNFLYADSSKKVAHSSAPILFRKFVCHIEFKQCIGNFCNFTFGNVSQVHAHAIGINQRFALIPSILSPSNLQSVQIKTGAYPANSLRCGSEALSLTTSYPYGLCHTAPFSL